MGKCHYRAVLLICAARRWPERDCSLFGIGSLCELLFGLSSLVFAYASVKIRYCERNTAGKPTFVRENLLRIRKSTFAWQSCNSSENPRLWEKSCCVFGNSSLRGNLTMQAKTHILREKSRYAYENSPFVGEISLYTRKPTYGGGAAVKFKTSYVEVRELRGWGGWGERRIKRSPFAEWCLHSCTN